jgi:hypothetical protein
MKDNIYINLLKYGVKKSNGFNFQKVIAKFPSFDEWEREIVKENMENAHYNKGMVGSPGFGKKDSIFYCIHYGTNNATDKDNNYIITPEAYFNYIDYLELKEARKTAKKAHTTSIIAIGIATAALIASIIFSIIEIYS